MEPKKNPKADLTKRSILFFQLGLILVLLITWRAIEYKTYEKEAIDTGQINMDMLEEEDVPITEIQNTPPPPPPPPPAPEVIEVVEDEAEVEEDIIESTETTQEEVVEVQEVQVAEVEEEIADVPFTIIEDVPVYPGCEKYSTNEERKKCMNQKIQEFFSENFDRDVAMEYGLTGMTKTYVSFKIDKNGEVQIQAVRGTHKVLEEEAKRVTKNLPDMKPGRQRGQPVGVLYSIPVIFRVED